VHYFQGPSFFFCLGGGLSLLEGSWLWLLMGLVGAIGSSGFPRFVASYELLQILLHRRGRHLRHFVAGVADYYSIYWKPGTGPTRIIVLPRSRQELIFAAKQYVGFPGHMFVYAAAAILTVAQGMATVWVKGFLVLYALVLGGNTVYATASYLRTLSKVPVGGEPGDQR
jgi:hypothetical protein